MILPNSSAATYALVKYWADVKFGIHTVCVLAQNLEKGAQYWANVALKFNLKRGGVNQLLTKQLDFLNEGNTMVVGIDVSHPAPKSMEGYPSIAAVVAVRIFGVHVSPFEAIPESRDKYWGFLHTPNVF